jgi:hypothetical protein
MTTIRTLVRELGARQAVNMRAGARSVSSKASWQGQYFYSNIQTRGISWKPNGSSPRVEFFTSPVLRSQTGQQALLRSGIKTPSSLLKQVRARLFHTSRRKRDVPRPNPTEHLGSPGSKGSNENLSLGQRMRKLSREYGWAAVGVYLGLSMLDFPFCYLLVLYLGTERIGEWEHQIIQVIEDVIPDSIQQKWHDWRAAFKQAEREATGHEVLSEGAEMAGWGVEEAQRKNKQEASTLTFSIQAESFDRKLIFCY